MKGYSIEPWNSIGFNKVASSTGVSLFVVKLTKDRMQNNRILF